MIDKVKYKKALDFAYKLHFKELIKELNNLFGSNIFE